MSTALLTRDATQTVVPIRRPPGRAETLFDQWYPDTIDTYEQRREVYALCTRLHREVVATCSTEGEADRFIEAAIDAQWSGDFEAQWLDGYTGPRVHESAESETRRIRRSAALTLSYQWSAAHFYESGVMLLRLQPDDDEADDDEALPSILDRLTPEQREYALAADARGREALASQADPIEQKITAEQERQHVVNEARRRNAAKLNPVTPLRVHTLTGLMQDPAISWWVEGFLAKGTISVLGGDGGVGKSALMVELSARVATGTPFLHDFKTTPGRVLYVAAEGRAGYGVRLNAVQRSHIEIPEDRFALVDEGVSLTNEASVAQLCAYVAANRFDVVILDTLSQLAAVESENDAAEMARVINQAKRVVDARPGASVLISAHTNKASGTLRGSSAIRDNVDAVWMARGDKDAFTLSNRPEHGGKMRDGQPLTIKGLSLVPAFGSVVVERATMPTTTPAEERGAVVLDLMEAGRAYSKAEVSDLMRTFDAGISETTIKRDLAALVASGALVKAGRGEYQIAEGSREGSGGLGS